MTGRPPESLRPEQSKPMLLRIAGQVGLAAFGAMVGAILGMVTAAVFGVLLGIGVGMIEMRLSPPPPPGLADDPVLMGAAFLGLAGGLLGAWSGAISGAVTLATGRVELGCASAVLSTVPAYLILPPEPEVCITIASVMAAGGILTAIGLRIAADMAERILP